VVLGASMIGGASVSFSLMAGLLLSNFPEALSSSVGMRERNTAFSKIFWMWASLMLICGISSMSGNVFLQGASPMFSTLVEGMAAGAMLTMIAETMLPEAYHQGGSITGISTLLGFLAAVLSKMLE
jgi:zinc transporter ZupT